LRAQDREGWREALARIRIRFMAQASSWWWGDRLDGRFLLARWAGERSRGRVLDLGCGPGIILAEVDPGLPRAGIDRDLGALKVAARLNPGAVLAAADWRALPFGAGAFETVFLSGILCANIPLEVKEGIMSELVRVLRPGGRLLLFETNRLHWATGRFNPNQMDLPELKEYLARWGFTVTEAVGWNLIPSLVFFLPRALKKSLSRKGHRYKYFFVPGHLTARIPGLPSLLERLGRLPGLSSRARSFVVQARAGEPDQVRLRTTPISEANQPSQPRRQ